MIFKCWLPCPSGGQGLPPGAQAKRAACCRDSAVRMQIPWETAVADLWPLRKTRSEPPRIPSDEPPTRAASPGQQTPSRPLSHSALPGGPGITFTWSHEGKHSVSLLFVAIKENLIVVWRITLGGCTGRAEGEGPSKGKQIGCLWRSSVRRQSNLVPSDPVGRTMATRGPMGERAKETDGEMGSRLPRMRRQNK